jgi:signal transduction histidine kinase
MVISRAQRHELELIVSAAAVPMLIVDYTPIISRYAGLTTAEVEERLENDDELMTCLTLPTALAVSAEWIDLYGTPASDEPPDLTVRQFAPSTHPDLAASMRTQFLAPFTGAASITREHTAPTMVGDVVVRSHWKAAIHAGEPDYTRVVIVDLDVTDLLAARRALQDSLEVTDKLIATVGHELKHPVAAMMGFGAILLEDWDKLSDDDKRELAGTLVEQTDDIALLIDDLLAAAASGSMAVTTESLSLGEVMEAVDLRGVDVDLGDDPHVIGDPLRIRQVLRNLVANARRHGGPNIALRARQTGPTINISVVDDGDGLDGDLAEKLFEMFAHGGRTGSFGIGLSVSRMLARAMGGDLLLASRAGPTAFELRLRAPAG